MPWWSRLFSAVLLMLANGRIAGVAASSAVGGSGEIGWRLAFVLGLIAGPFPAIAVRRAAAGEWHRCLRFGSPLAGLLVGFGGNSSGKVLILAGPFQE